MKKIFGILVVAVTIISSTFAFDMAIGGRGLIGGNVGTDKAMTNGEGLVLGGGAYLNLGFFGGLGLQAEVNFVSTQVTTGTNSVTTTPCNMVDIPVMLWGNFNIAKFAFGGGVGINFGTYTNNFSSGSTGKLNIGLAAGLNIKYYFNRFLGIVIGANGVFDFFPTQVVQGANGSTTYLFGSGDNKRKSIYGTLGLEFKLF